jgi:carotenoid 1,2-hydratase
MTERGRASLARDTGRLAIGNSVMQMRDGRLLIDFAEMALPWPGQRLLPKMISGSIEITPDQGCDRVFDLDGHGHHVWSPRMPRATARIMSGALPGGGWEGRAYHDMNFGDRPIEQDFIGWDWARGSDGPDGDTVILYDSVLRSGGSRRLALRCSGLDDVERFAMPGRQALPRAFWGLRPGIACDEGMRPARKVSLEDSPFYARALVDTVVDGRQLTMVHETLDCRRLANPLVRMMLPFRMPRSTRAIHARA